VPVDGVTGNLYAAMATTPQQRQQQERYWAMATT